MDVKVPCWGAEVASTPGGGHTCLWLQQCLLTWLQVARSHLYFSQSCLRGTNVRWLVIIKAGQCVWSEVHLRPNRSCSGLTLCCGGGGKAKRRANITERFSSQQLPEPGGVSLHLFSPRYPHCVFPAALQALTPALCWVCPGHRATPFSLSEDGKQGGRNKLPDPTIIPMGWDPAGQTLPPTESKQAPTLLAPPVRPPPRLCSTSQCGGGFWQPWAPVPWWDCPSLVAKGSAILSPHMPQPRGSCGTSFHRGEQGEPEEVAPTSAPVRVCTPTLALLRFQELGSFFISAWRYPRNFRKYIGSCASTDLILICELGFFFLLKLFGGATMPKLGWEGKRDSVFQCSYFLSFWLLISRSEK